MRQTFTAKGWALVPELPKRLASPRSMDRWCEQIKGRDLPKRPRDE